MMPADNGHRDDRQQRRRLGLDLAEVEQEHEGGNEDQPAADSEEPAERARQETDHDGSEDLHHQTSSQAAMAARSPANA